MNKDHLGNFYSVGTDDEERFEFLVKQIKTALIGGKISDAKQYEALLNQEFSKDLFTNRSC